VSKRTITKEVEAVICDFCASEIDTKGKDYCYHHMPAYEGNVVEARKYNVKHFMFGWFRPSKYDALGEKYVRYDFHAACFDELMTKFLKEEGAS
jgi:hypothetical protein